MRTNSIKRWAWGLVLAVGVAALVWLAWPRPIAVDLAMVTKGPMEVTVDDEAKTRVRHVYRVYAPTAGKVLRISNPPEVQGVSVHVGDRVTANETVVAVMQGVTPSFIDIRTQEQLQAALDAADAAVNLAEAEIQRIEAAVTFSQSELRRAEALARTQVISDKSLDKARLDVKTNEAALASAKAQLEVRRSERASVAARLIDPTKATDQQNSTCCIRLRSPVTGRVLKIIQDTEAVVPAGAPLVEIGNPTDLEVIADLLSSDAVRVKADSPVRIDGWGGPPIRGRVRQVEPAGFLKVSALGIEEQRVRTTIDLVDPPDVWSRLGHDYRVIVHVAIWKSENALRVPVGALFREREHWAVFAVKDGRARVTSITVGHRNNRVAEVLAGLSEGDRVVLHPSDRIGDGVAVAARPSR